MNGENNLNSNNIKQSNSNNMNSNNKLYKQVGNSLEFDLNFGSGLPPAQSSKRVNRVGINQYMRASMLSKPLLSHKKAVVPAAMWQSPFIERMKKGHHHHHN